MPQAWQDKAVYTYRTGAEQCAVRGVKFEYQLPDSAESKLKTEDAVIKTAYSDQAYQGNINFHCDSNGRSQYSTEIRASEYC